MGKKYTLLEEKKKCDETFSWDLSKPSIQTRYNFPMQERGVKISGSLDKDQ